MQNIGDGIPNGMADALFDSMVSIRGESEDDTQLHLGLGLHIAQMINPFPGFNIQIAERPCDNIDISRAKGVVVTLAPSVK